MEHDTIETVTARFRQWVDHRDGEDVADPYDGLTAWHLMEDMEQLARLQVSEGEASPQHLPVDERFSPEDFAEIRQQKLDAFQPSLAHGEEVLRHRQAHSD